MSKWRRTQPKDLRPFYGCRSIYALLDNAQVRIGGDGERNFGPNVSVEPAQLTGTDVTIFPEVNSKILADELGSAANLYALVLAVRDASFKRRLLERRFAVPHEIPETITLEADRVDELAHASQLEFSLAICLTETREGPPGWPLSVGTWLASKSFCLRKQPDKRLGFDLQALSQEIRNAHGLPENSLVFAELVAPVDTVLEEGESFATCYLAEPILDALRSNRETNALNSVVEAEVIAAVLTAIRTEVDDGEARWEPEPGSPMASVLERLGKSRALSMSEFRDLSADGQKLRAVVHDRLDTVRDLEKL